MSLGAYMDKVKAFSGLNKSMRFLGPFRAIRCLKRSLEAFRSLSRALGANNDLRAFKFPRDFIGAFSVRNWTFRDFTGPLGTSETLRDFQGPYGILRDFHGPYRIFNNLSGSSGTLQDLQGPYGTLRNLFRPSGT